MDRLHVKTLTRGSRRLTQGFKANSVCERSKVRRPNGNNGLKHLHIGHAQSGVIPAAYKYPYLLTWIEVDSRKSGLAN